MWARLREDVAKRPPSRWDLIRDIAVFQLKLGVDAARDLILVPVSLVAGAIDLVSGGDVQGRLFYQVLITGRRSEDWINLFGEADRTRSRSAERLSSADPGTVDAFVQRVERLLIDQYERGGLTASAKDAIDRSLNAFSADRRKPADEIESGKRN